MAFVTLHLGTASFLPLHSGRAPGAEVFAVPQAVRERIRSCRREGGRVIAVGTSVVRALESSTERPDAGWGSTSLFIQPGYTFGCIDGIVTNFHQPATTHLQLVEAFMGRRLTEESYQHALSQGFRFLSYGDGMFVC